MISSSLLEIGVSTPFQIFLSDLGGFSVSLSVCECGEEETTVYMVLGSGDKSLYVSLAA